MNNLKKNIKKEILKLGFDSIGYSEPYVDEKTKQRYKNFLNKNYHGDMKWLERHFEKKTNPKKIWDKVETIIVLGQNYGPKDNPLFLNKDKPLLDRASSIVISFLKKLLIFCLSFLPGNNSIPLLTSIPFGLIVFMASDILFIFNPPDKMILRSDNPFNNSHWKTFPVPPN